MTNNGDISIGAIIAALEAANKRADDALNLRRSEYRYIGLDGKMTTAAALEDERDALRARVAELEERCK